MADMFDNQIQIWIPETHIWWAGGYYEAQVCLQVSQKGCWYPESDLPAAKRTSDQSMVFHFLIVEILFMHFELSLWSCQICIFYYDLY